MAKKRKKKISKTEKKLRNKLKYRQSVIRKIIKNTPDVSDDKKTFNENWNKVKEANKDLSKIQKKLERFKYKPKLPKTYEEEATPENTFGGYAIWEFEKFVNNLFNLIDTGLILSVNGKKAKTDRDKIHDILNNLKMKMDSIKKIYGTFIGNEEFGNVNVYITESEILPDNEK